MSNTPSLADRDVLAQLIAHSLLVADTMGLASVGIALNDALVQLTGEGIAPQR